MASGGSPNARFLLHCLMDAVQITIRSVMPLVAVEKAIFRSLGMIVQSASIL